MLKLNSHKCNELKRGRTNTCSAGKVKLCECEIADTLKMSVGSEFTSLHENVSIAFEMVAAFAHYGPASTTHR